MSDHGANGNGEAEDWRERAEQWNEIRALERRMGSLETAVQVGFREVMLKLQSIADRIDLHRHDVVEAYKQLVQLAERQDAADKRSREALIAMRAQLEQRRRRKK